MFLGIDVGNTTVRLYLCKLAPFFLVEEDIYDIKDFNDEKVLEKLENVSIVVLCSVVDEVEDRLLSLFQGKRGINVYKIDSTITSIDFSSYSSNVGADRIATCLGALSYGFLPFCVVDMGTATTFSVVDQRREYKGGFIIPGIGSMFRSLHDYTSRLPLVGLKDAVRFSLGLDTKESIRNGVYSLNFEGIKGIMKNIRDVYLDIKFFGTGGWSKFFYRIFDINDPYLMVKGMYYFLKEEVKL